jgi:hypothetical protein
MAWNLVKHVEDFNFYLISVNEYPFISGEKFKLMKGTEYI